MYFTGEDTPGEDFSMMGTLNPAPPKGYDFDFIDREALLKRVEIKNGRITLPDGVSYRVMVLPEKKVMSLDVLRKLRDLVNKGMILVGPPPERTPGLSGYANNDAELKGLVREIWGKVNGTTVKERNTGLGKVCWGQSLQTILDKANIKPDFEYSSRSGDAPINYIHRRIDDSEVYFVANRRRTTEQVVAGFRVTGKKPELWNADTGSVTSIEVYDVVDGKTIVPLQFDPSGSFFVVFRTALPSTRIKVVEKEGRAIVSTNAFPVPKQGRYSHISNNFTISTWIKPETEENFSGVFGLNRGPSSNVFYPLEGGKVYGTNHAACGLVAARNGFIVYERESAHPSNVLVIPMPVSGWTHIALVYKNGAPLLYVNGSLAKEGVASGKIVHPGLHEATQDHLSWFFEGDMSEPQLFGEVLTEDRIRQLVNKGMPGPDEPLAVQFAPGTKGGLLFWQNGRYTLRNNAGQSSLVQVTAIEKPVELNGSWTVSFPPGLGAPAQITLPKLISLHKHNEDGVKYFSGTATYTKNFTVPAQTLMNDKQLFLDLGRVEVIAEVKVNDKSLGVLWKPPFIVNITKAVKTGENKVEIQVTNLWPNRLIGDEQLPAENEYASSGSGNSIGAIRKLPDWFVQGSPKPSGGRVTFTTWKHYTKDAPLLESGLLGPVCLRSALEKVIKY
jgi:hypothetical protein